MPSALLVDPGERVVAAIEADASRRQTAKRLAIISFAHMDRTPFADGDGRTLIAFTHLKLAGCQLSVDKNLLGGGATGSFFCLTNVYENAIFSHSPRDSAPSAIQ